MTVIWVNYMKERGIKNALGLDDVFMTGVSSIAGNSAMWDRGS